ncbi:hypothetical protein DACRYDRAFT_107469 [Dacryopinax primogenitus]|uniref:Uncharacterized protein n=1 Tax=Dacryopinax primogenitus (strain DJM 731) TaxID=1858805 RepID=M5G7C3_DACPD|nr:uncharacterized protein DACRYDRAFT_107469 [Dacryopinax primogenitus]EJU01727.1 hypothetical protein DACRYDRAFT_107469 [Dacryopinax primogenitus]
MSQHFIGSGGPAPDWSNEDYPLEHIKILAAAAKRAVQELWPFSIKERTVWAKNLELITAFWDAIHTLAQEHQDQFASLSPAHIKYMGLDLQWLWLSCQEGKVKTKKLALHGVQPAAPLEILEEKNTVQLIPLLPRPHLPHMTSPSADETEGEDQVLESDSEVRVEDKKSWQDAVHRCFVHHNDMAEEGIIASKNYALPSADMHVPLDPKRRSE